MVKSSVTIEIKTVPLSSIKLNPNNPRQITTYTGNKAVLS